MLLQKALSQMSSDGFRRCLTERFLGFDFFFRECTFGALEETGVAGTSSVGMKWSLEVTVLEAPGSTPSLNKWGLSSLVTSLETRCRCEALYCCLGFTHHNITLRALGSPVVCGRMRSM
uniref:Uncharacterized protein n=1 Tax=Chromera velia CCMP2878 TaxID=1169474 RepID=A0A0G4F332_9ALVE|eukprot:Cvel_14792.t1-p1 / transcript=Cvel_14792.t1 / gene=Cvel_14792 / organism=Chromera_velia_CCMP2878 / gene_product=hypothetical protein / transcript_product=hypothetical protein / location=Cvel_scaffold1066:14073-17508(-) / protein_length=118 / sequence_SO=supercontig / SO=protein_coding / is_pseudo=false